MKTKQKICSTCGKKVTIKTAWQDAKSFKLYCSIECLTQQK
jgi:hypothetical protein